MTQQLARMNEQNEVAISRGGDVDVNSLLSKIIDSGRAGEAAGAVKELVLLQEHQQDRYARQQFIEAFARVRAKCRKINASRANPGKDGGVRWWMASLIDLQDEVEPILREEGMDLSFDTRREGPQSNIVIGICIIMHVASGHVERRECGVNAASAQGGDLGAATTAKRGALIAALGLRIEHDNDARMLGDIVSPEQAAELRRRLHAVGGDEQKFLAFAGAAEWKNIRQGKLSQLHDFLTRKERGGPGAGKDTKPAGPVAGPKDEADRIRKEQDAAAEAPHQVPVDSAEEENREIVARERAETLADNAVTSGGKVLQDAFRAVPPAILQTIINDHKFPPFKDRTKEQNRELLIMCQLEIIKKG